MVHACIRGLRIQSKEGGGQDPAGNLHGQSEYVRKHLDLHEGGERGVALCCSWEEALGEEQWLVRIGKEG